MHRSRLHIEHDLDHVRAVSDQMCEKPGGVSEWDNVGYHVTFDIVSARLQKL